MKAALSLIVLPLIAATTLGVSTAASAAPEKAPQMKVYYDDLNLTSKKGQDAFKLRLRQAAKKGVASMIVRSDHAGKSRTSHLL